MLLGIQKHDICVAYVPGREMRPADTLRRTYLPESTQGDTEAELETEKRVNYPLISAQRPKLQKVTNRILAGWPNIGLTLKA